MTQILTIFFIIIRLISEWIEIIVLISRADRFEAVITVFLRLFVRVLPQALVWAGARQATMLAGFLLLLLNISTWQCPEHRRKGQFTVLHLWGTNVKGPLTFPFLALLFGFCCGVIEGSGCCLCRQVNTQQAIQLLPVRSWKMLLNQGLQHTPE